MRILWATRNPRQKLQKILDSLPFKLGFNDSQFVWVQGGPKNQFSTGWIQQDLYIWLNVSNLYDTVICDKHPMPFRGRWEQAILRNQNLWLAMRILSKSDKASFPIGSMGLVYLPKRTFSWFVSKFVYIDIDIPWILYMGLRTNSEY